MMHLGFWSLVPAIVALGLAIKTKRVIESLLAGILLATIIIDYNQNGIVHSVVYSINNLFGAIAGHPADAEAGLRGVGVLRSAGRVEIVLVVLLLGAFITILDRSGGAFAFGEWLSSKVKTKRGAMNATAIMGCSLFTSAYFSSLATGTVFKPIYDKMKISREKLAYILDSTSAPINVLIPISGWVAYMGALMVDNIPEVDDPIVGLVKTIPYNFYVLVTLVFVFLLANGVIKDFGPMKKAESYVNEGGSPHTFGGNVEGENVMNGKASDMIVPLGVSVLMLVVLGLWNYTLVPLIDDLPSIPFGGNGMLLVSFSLGLIVAFVKYVTSGLMTAKSFLEEALEGTKSAIIGAMIIVLAVTLGDLMRASYGEGLGTAVYLGEIVGDAIPSSVLPFAVFVFSSIMAFAMGTSWGVWGMMMPIAVPLTLAVGGNPFLTAAAVLSGGTFGDHCSPISDTTIMSSLGADVEHMDHVNTQLPYAITTAVVSAVLFLIVGFIV